MTLEKMMGAIIILGVFVADTAYRANRQPKTGETIIGNYFALGPGGKGSNQAVAAARLGADVAFLTRLGDDSFAKMAYSMWETEGVRPIGVKDSSSFTGAAYIFINDDTGDNAIIVVPGAGYEVSSKDLEANRAKIESASLFMTQLETPIEVAHYGLKMARDASVITVLNPAPSADINPKILSLCDFLTPNETEATDLTGIPIHNIEDAGQAADKLRKMGVGTVIITLGSNGAYFDDGIEKCHIQPVTYSDTVETTGAGDCFCGAFAYAVTSGMNPLQSARYACVAASISVTRKGTAPSMPTQSEVTEFITKLGFEIV